MHIYAHTPNRCHPERSEAESKDPCPYRTASLGKRIPPRALLGRNDTSVVQCLTKSAQHYMGVIRTPQCVIRTPCRPSPCSE